MSILTMQDDTHTEGLTEQAAVEALMNRGDSSKKEEPKGNDEDEADDENPGTEAPVDEGDEEEEAGEEADPEGEGPAPEAAKEQNEQSKEATDDHLVKISVDGQDVTIPVKDLKRLYGQEASLTRKSQDVSNRLKEADEVGGRHAAALEAILEEAADAYKPYAELDWIVLATQLDPEELSLLRGEAKAAHERYERILGKAKDFQADVGKRREAATSEQITQAVETLKADIPGFDQKVYGDILSHAVKSGIAEDDAKAVTDPSILKIIHDAMLYRRGLEVATKKVNKTPTKTLTNGTSDARPNEPSQKQKALDARFKKSGREDDAVALLMGRWAKKR